MLKMRRQMQQQPSFFTLFLPLFLLAPFTAYYVDSATSLASDATALLAFKSGADLHSKLPYSSINTTTTSLHYYYCDWVGVKKCTTKGGRVTRLVIEGLGLGGIFAPDSLSRLDQLRVLSLENNLLTGTIPDDLSRLVNLKTLFLDHNSFTGSFPPSIFSLHRIKTLDLSYNRLAGPLPLPLTTLDRLNYLRLDSNSFNGTIPAFNQSSLLTFNVSGNSLTGAIPVTAVLSRFRVSSYSGNLGLCGEILHKECRPGLPFFHSSTTAPPTELHGANVNLTTTQPSSNLKKKKKIPFVIGFSCGAALILIGSVLCFAAAAVRINVQGAAEVKKDDDAEGARAAAILLQIEQEKELEEKVNVKRMQQQVGKSGSLAFCAGEAQLYTVEQLMRAAAEMLGRGIIGTTYKVVLDNQLIVSVKRLDSTKMQEVGTTKEAFQHHMEAVGGLRHPNLVPLRAYLQAKEERLLVYDYQPNGSLFSLIHGSKSSRAKPLHWTSCLKIAEDVAQGLSYIHQAWRLIHGNLKSSNVLLGPDFEACISDYCLTVFSSSNASYPPQPDDLNPNYYDLIAYRAPETHHSSSATNKSDVYSFGVLLLELLTSKPPSEHPGNTLEVDEIMNWVRSTRKDDGVGGDDDKLGMLLEVACACRLWSPDQRPTMWQVLKMLQEIKDGALYDNDKELLVDSA